MRMWLLLLCILGMRSRVDLRRWAEILPDSPSVNVRRKRALLWVYFRWPIGMPREVYLFHLQVSDGTRARTGLGEGLEVEGRAVTMRRNSSGSSNPGRRPVPLIESRGKPLCHRPLHRIRAVPPVPVTVRGSRVRRSREPIRCMPIWCALITFAVPRY